jgi:hypothetical protein
MVGLIQHTGITSLVYGTLYFNKNININNINVIVSDVTSLTILQR